MDKQDEKLQRKLKLQGLLDNIAVLRADMVDDMAYAETQLEAGKQGFISDSGLNRFNYFLGIKAGLNMVLNRFANYEDELVGDNVKSHVKVK